MDMKAVLLFVSGMALASRLAMGDIHIDIDDYSDITWAHAVNSRADLEKYLNSSVMFIEADISWGKVNNDTGTEMYPIMAHPPNVRSDISFKSWIEAVIANRSTRGIKLDFKSADVLEPCLVILTAHADQLNFPLWLNADILRGPGPSPAQPVDAHKFTSLCNEYFPDRTLSIGWTTLVKNGIQKGRFYTWRQVLEMYTVVVTNLGSTSKHELTFAVRASLIGQSYPQLRWLTDVLTNSTLTVWGYKDDDMKVSELFGVRRTYSKKGVFYDLPGPLAEEFNKVKNSLKPDPNDTRINLDMRKWRNDNGCAIIGNETIVFPSDDCEVNYTESFPLTPSNPLHFQGTIRFILKALSINEFSLTRDNMSMRVNMGAATWVELFQNTSLKYSPNLELIEQSGLILRSDCYEFAATLPEGDGRNGGNLSLDIGSIVCSDNSTMSQASFKFKMADVGRFVPGVAYRGSSESFGVLSSCTLHRHSGEVGSGGRGLWSRLRHWVFLIFVGVFQYISSVFVSGNSVYN